MANKPRATVHGVGLWGFKNVSTDPHNSHTLSVRLSTRVSPLAKKQLMDAIYAWMCAQKLIAENGGRPIAPEQAVELVKSLNHQGRTT